MAASRSIFHSRRSVVHQQPIARQHHPSTPPSCALVRHEGLLCSLFGLSHSLSPQRSRPLGSEGTPSACALRRFTDGAASRLVASIRWHHWPLSKRTQQRLRDRTSPRRGPLQRSRLLGDPVFCEPRARARAHAPVSARSSMTRGHDRCTAEDGTARPLLKMMWRQSWRSTELPPVLQALAEGSSTLSA